MDTASQQPGSKRGPDRNLMQRLGSVALLLPLVLWTVHHGGWALAALLAVCALLGAWELAAMSLPERRLLWPVSVLAAGVTPLVFTAGAAASAHLHDLWTAVLLLTLVLRLFWPGPLEGAGSEVARAMLAGVYASQLGYLTALRQLGPEQSWSGAAWLLICLGATWGADTGGYFGGRLLGRTKLFPRVSPAKTVEGLLCGVATAVAAVLAFRSALLPQLPLVHAVVLALLGSLGGTVGDLAESLLKRAYHVKDSGHIIPGHGGILDRVDALLFSGPVMYLYIWSIGLASP